MFFATGNRITDNACSADDGRALISRALADIETEHGWKPVDEHALFTGVYYDSAKVGSFITRATNERDDHAVIKLQLRPLPFDEGFIIRHVQRQIRTNRVRLPVVHLDVPWSETKGYGYLILEDLSALPHLWARRPDEEAFGRHKIFLEEFMHRVLPIEPFLPVPQMTPKEKYRDSLEHFSAIATASRHRHIDASEIEKMKASYLHVLDRVAFDDFHFTHGHLSGHEIVEDRTSDTFILFANLMWSFRPTYYELLFPLWVDLMDIRDVNVSVQDLRDRIDRWIRLWREIEADDPAERQLFWFGVLERSMMTVMLDLGASEWNVEEQGQKLALLEAWKEVFHWVIKTKC